jgi:hypothetical protein
MASKLNSNGLPIPADQSARVIFFRLYDKGGWDNSMDKAPSKVAGNSMEGGHTLAINPEDLTITEPSRVAVQQTMGGAWVDSFGPGLRTINISGVTGWRAKHAGGRDWEDEYKSLHEEAFKYWHTLRSNKIEKGNDPDDIKLEFVDTLDRVAVYVVPQQFVLKRSKSRPLLVQYNISMIVTENIGYDFSTIDKAMSPDEKLAYQSFLDAIKFIENLAKSINEIIDVVMAPILALLSVVNRALKAVGKLMASVGNIMKALFSIIKKIIAAVRAIFAMLSAMRNFASALRFMWQQVCGAFGELKCLFAGGLRGMITIENYGDFNGASNCSSTTGGSPMSPLRDVNGLALIPVGSRAAALPRPVSAPESAARKLARKVLADARRALQRANNARDSAKREYDFAKQYALDHPSVANTAREESKLAAFNMLFAAAITAQSAADAAEVTYATTI